MGCVGTWRPPNGGSRCGGSRLIHVYAGSKVGWRRVGVGGTDAPLGLGCVPFRSLMMVVML